MWRRLISIRTFATAARSTAGDIETTAAAEARKKLLEVASWADGFTREKIPKDKLDISFNRSRGPGGQNVNKGLIELRCCDCLAQLQMQTVNSKAELRFKLMSASWLPEYTRQNLSNQEKNRLNKEGEFIVTSERHRTQSQNLEDCFVKLHEMIMKASEVPKEASPETKARIAKLAEIAKLRRMAEKKHQSSKKSNRAE